MMRPVGRLIRRTYRDGPQNRPRRGFSLLEFEVAMVVLGIGIVGLLPLSVVHSRVTRNLEQRYSSQGEWYLAASHNRWEQKLGASASLSATDPGAAPETPEFLADDGDTEYADDGWTEEAAPSAHGEDLHRAATAEGMTASWTFDELPTGWYQVQATWTESPAQSASAPYRIFDGDDLLGEVSVDQQNPPSGVEYQSRYWQILDTKYFDAGTARIELLSQADAEVVADAVRLVLVKNDVQITSLDESIGSETVTAHVSVSVQVPQ